MYTTYTIFGVHWCIWCTSNTFLEQLCTLKFSRRKMCKLVYIGVYGVHKSQKSHTRFFDVVEKGTPCTLFYTHRRKFFSVDISVDKLYI